MYLISIKTQKQGGCQQCAYVLGGTDADVGMRCGYNYYQQPAVERKVEKLSNFPSVGANNTCPNWILKST
jgi:hypothetical protein